MTKESTQQNPEENSESSDKSTFKSGTFGTEEFGAVREGVARTNTGAYHPNEYPPTDKRFPPNINTQQRQEYPGYEKARPRQGWSMDERVGDLRQGEPGSDMDYTKTTDWNQPDAAPEYHRYWDQREEHIGKFGSQSFNIQEDDLSENNPHDPHKKTYVYSKYDNQHDLTTDEIIEWAINEPQHYPGYQLKNFVIETQLTHWRKCHQIKLEIQTRHKALQTANWDQLKLEGEIDLLKEDIEQDPHMRPGQRKIHDSEIKRREYDMWYNRRQNKQAAQEMEIFTNELRNLIDTKEELYQIDDNADQKEIEYWQVRMGKQAAMDMMAYGRVGVGNMEAITQMPVEDQSRVLQITIDYAGQLSEAMMGIEENLKLGTMEGVDPKYLADLRQHVDNDELAEAKAKMLAMADANLDEVHTANPTVAKPGGQISMQHPFKVAPNPSVSRHSDIPTIKENEESIRPNEANKKVDPMGIN